MKKALVMLLTLGFSISMFVGCSGKPVVNNAEEKNTETVVTENRGEGTEADGASSSTLEAKAVKTGLSIVTSLSATAATAEKDGTAQADITVVAVTVDEAGVINSCVIDQIQGKNTFSASGELTTEAKEFPSKNELGEAYGMKAYAGSKYEWNEQAAAVAEYVVGKTVEEVKGIAVNESGVPTDVDLVSSATISISSFILGIEEAVNNAVDLGASHWDTLKVVSMNNSGTSEAATAEKDGNAQVYANIAAVTIHEEEITSYIIDSVQANISFNTAGEITSDLTAEADSGRRKS